MQPTTIDQLLRAAGLSRRQLCRERVIARDTIIRLEKGLPVYRSSVEHLAARLAIPVDELRALLGHPLEVLR